MPVSSLTAREMFDLIERNPGAWARYVWTERAHAPGAVEVAPIARAGLSEDAGRCFVLLPRAAHAEPVARWPSVPRDEIELVGLRAADGRVLWQRDQPPEVDEVIRTAGALDLLADSLDNYTLHWTAHKRGADATFNGNFRDGTPFHPDEHDHGWRPPVFPDASAAIDDVFHRRAGITRSS